MVIIIDRNIYLKLYNCIWIISLEYLKTYNCVQRWLLLLSLLLLLLLLLNRVTWNHIIMYKLPSDAI